MMSEDKEELTKEMRMKRLERNEVNQANYASGGQTKREFQGDSHQLSQILLTGHLG